MLQILWHLISLHCLPTIQQILTLFMLNKLRILPSPVLIVSQSDYLIQIVDINSHMEWLTVKIQICWLLQKPTDLDLYLQRQGISRSSRTRLNTSTNSNRDFSNYTRRMERSWGVPIFKVNTVTLVIFATKHILQIWIP